MLLNCGVGQTLESALDCEIKSVNPKGKYPWIFIVRTDAEAEVPYFGHLMQRTDSLEKILMLGKNEGRGEGDDRGWDDWMASLTRWTWGWASSRSWWWTGRPSVLQSIWSQRVRHDWAAELNWAREVKGSFREKVLKHLGLWDRWQKRTGRQRNEETVFGQGEKVI